MDEKERLGRRISEARVASCKTLLWLAFRAGTSPQQLSRYEKGRQMPSADVVRRIADALGVTSDWLLSRDVPRDTTPEAA